MALYDDQIRRRKQLDAEKFQDALFGMASVVMDRKTAGEAEDQRTMTRDVIDEILKYYHYQPVDIPDSITDPIRQLEYALRPSGLMYRFVRLDDRWTKEAFGPMIGTRKSDGCPVALMPRTFGGYEVRAEGESHRIRKQDAADIGEDAICFYRPLPQKKLGIQELLAYMKDCISPMDWVFVVLLTLLVTSVGMLSPGITRMLTGFVLETGNKSILLGTSVFLFTAVIMAGLLNSVRTLTVGRFSTKLNLGVESSIMMRLLSLPAPFFRQYSSPELVSRTRQVGQLCMVLMEIVAGASISGIVSLLYVVEIFHYAPILVWPSLGIITATAVLTVVTALVQGRVTRKVMDLQGKESGISNELINGIQKIKVAGAEKRAYARWAKAYTNRADAAFHPPALLLFNGVLTTAIHLIGNIVMYHLAVKGNVPPSNYIAFSSAFGAVSGAFMTIASLTTQIAGIKPILDYTAPLLQAEPEMTEGKEILTEVSGDIELNGVFFRYNDRMPYVINGIDLKIRHGEYTAIVGTSGCGKSTLIRLILGFETPERGAVYFDGKDLRSVDTQSLRRKIGTVTQDGKLFPGDIYSNIVITAPELTVDQAWEAAELAGIAEDIRAMPLGMHTMISEGQGGISGGQRQRLMIARAVAPRPKVLIMDEATSALDNITQKHVSDSLERIGSTRIVIAHRLSTIRNCDRILVMDRGQIVGDGTYDQLMETSPLFQELVKRQQMEDESQNPVG